MQSIEKKDSTIFSIKQIHFRIGFKLSIENMKKIMNCLK